MGIPRRSNINRTVTSNQSERPSRELLYVVEPSTLNLNFSIDKTKFQNVDKLICLTSILLGHVRSKYYD